MDYDLEISPAEAVNENALSRYYNREVSGLPYCYAVVPEEFRAGLQWHEDRDEVYPELSDDRLIAARAGGELVGFAHICFWSSEAEESHRLGYEVVQELLEPRVGLIRFFHFTSGHRKAGQQILEAAEAAFALDGVRQVRAFSYYPYRFYRFDRAFLSDKMGHVRGVLSLNGYRITRAVLLLDLADYYVDAPRTCKVVSPQVSETGGRGERKNVTIHLLRAGEKIGIAEMKSLGHYCRAAGAQDAYYVEWFWIAEQEQGKGLGQYLLQVGLREMQQRGFKRAILYAAVDNPRAQLLYTNAGFRVVDNNYQFFKILDGSLPAELFQRVGF